jgi:hypothetical protein
MASAAVSRADHPDGQEHGGDPTHATGFTLQSTTNLGSSVWTTNSLAPVVVNGQNTVTNPISGTQRFYRLSQ